MSELWLIAHKCRGEPAFDVATRIECPECGGEGEARRAAPSGGCVECDGKGYWYIIPTSGHRAYPYWEDVIEPDWIGRAPDIPESLPDHYRTLGEPARKIDISALRKPFTMNRRV